MTREQLNDFIGEESMSILEVMEKIDKNASGALFIEDKEGRLSGCITAVSYTHLTLPTTPYV